MFCRLARPVSVGFTDIREHVSSGPDVYTDHHGSDPDWEA